MILSWISVCFIATDCICPFRDWRYVTRKHLTSMANHCLKQAMLLIQLLHVLLQDKPFLILVVNNAQFARRRFLTKKWFSSVVISYAASVSIHASFIFKISSKPPFEEKQ